MNLHRDADQLDVWRNWAGDQTCRPAAFVRPRDRDELSSALALARRRRWEVRVAGAGHSFSGVVPTDGLLLSLDRMDRVLDVDTNSGDVRVEAGITLGELNDRLYERGRAFENLGDIAVQSLAGATATGTHGTGASYRNISSNVASLQLALADGSTIELNETSDRDGWRAARVGLGALGVVTAMTLKTVPAFTLRGEDTTQPLDVVLTRFDELVSQNDHFEFYTFPYSSTAWVRVNNRVEEEPRPRSRASTWFHDMFLVNTMYGLVNRTGRRFPASIPILNRTAASFAGGGTRVDRSYRIFASPRLVKFTESEYALPREHVVEAVQEIRKTIERNRFDVSFPIEVRVVAPDDALLSPAFERETAYVAVHMFERMEWEPYFRSVRAIMRAVGARPHWGKRHFETAETLRPLYPEWDRFQSVRRRLDPQGTFANAHLRRLLGPL